MALILVLGGLILIRYEAIGSTLRAENRQGRASCIPREAMRTSGSLAPVTGSVRDFPYSSLDAQAIGRRHTMWDELGITVGKAGGQVSGCPSGPSRVAAKNQRDLIHRAQSLPEPQSCYLTKTVIWFHPLSLTPGGGRGLLSCGVQGSMRH